jgi:hypothetical protein
LAGGLSAAEGFRRQDLAPQVLESQADDRLGRVVPPFVDDLIDRRRAERMLDPGIEIAQGEPDVFGSQAFWN